MYRSPVHDHHDVPLVLSRSNRAGAWARRPAVPLCTSWDSLASSPLGAAASPWGPSCVGRCSYCRFRCRRALQCPDVPQIGPGDLSRAGEGVTRRGWMSQNLVLVFSVLLCSGLQLCKSFLAVGSSDPEAPGLSKQQCWAVGPVLVEQFIFSGGHLHNY